MLCLWNAVNQHAGCVQIWWPVPATVTPLAVLPPESSGGSCIPFSCHASLVSFNLDQLRSLSLSLMSLTYLTYRDRVCRIFLHLGVAYVSDEIEIMHFWQEGCEVVPCLQRIPSGYLMSAGPSAGDVIWLS